MEFPREDLSNNRPPALLGTNFSYWKARMQIYILAQGEGVWNAIENEWKTPVDDKGNAKPRVDWSEEEKTEYDFNSKAMNAIYGAVSEDTFKLIASTHIAKIAWSILCDHHEGNTTVRQSKLQMIQTEFENLKMEEEENITQFSTRVLSISGDAFNLGEPIPEYRIVKKVLRSLPGRFQMKVTAIQENKDLNTYRLSDLIGNLQTYELEMLQSQKNNGKGIALQSTQEENSETDSETMEQSIVLLTKNFNRVLKKFNKSRNKNFSNNQGNSTNQKPSNPKRRDNTITEGIQCYECKGFGLIQSEYSEEDDSNTNFVAFTASHEDNNNDDMQELLEAYTQLNAKWEQIIKKNLELMEDNHYLKNEKERIEKQYKEAQKELSDFKNNEAKLLQEIKELTERPRTPITDTSENHQTETQEMSQQHFRHRRRIRHMTGNPENLAKIQYENEGYVTFGDGGRGRIVAKGTLNNEKDGRIGKIIRLRSDHGREFENSKFKEYCTENGIHHEFFEPKTPQQNGVVE
ncbi:PREDICTED: uncharacterized protein LOC109166624 [Ipomoea nil]|uniref:uncharacterized protein LOC109166624 n=1 Tax=Ipomoea nil TaxID=35883 RepID=UPI0009015708|nr:PREDICTED: uncharacterized protein LOC109166624 [Ipomoea nil]